MQKKPILQMKGCEENSSISERISLLGTSKVQFEGDNSKTSWLMQLQENQQKAQKTENQRRILRRLFFGAITGGEPQFSLGERVYLLWTAPVTKFWTFQVRYSFIA